MNKNISNIFKRLESNEPYWAYTGSVALFYHNKNKGYTPRTPHNIDIIVDPQWRSYVLSQLKNIGWNYTNVGNRTHFTKGNKQLDLLSAGKRFGKMNIVYTKNKIPILSTQSLFMLKKNILNNGGFSNTRNKNKTIRNIERLRLHGAKTPTKVNKGTRSKNIRGLRLNF